MANAANSLYGKLRTHGRDRGTEGYDEAGQHIKRSSRSQDLAQEFPRAKVVGIDIELPLSLQGMPSNCLFLQGNVLKGLPFQDQAFDFVHQRLLAAAIPAASWQPVVDELARVTRPGGFVELIEVSDIAGAGGAGQCHAYDASSPDGEMGGSHWRDDE